MKQAKKKEGGPQGRTDGGEGGKGKEMKDVVDLVIDSAPPSPTLSPKAVKIKEIEQSLNEAAKARAQMENKLMVCPMCVA